MQLQILHVEQRKAGLIQCFDKRKLCRLVHGNQTEVMTNADNTIQLFSIIQIVKERKTEISKVYITIRNQQTSLCAM